MVLNLPLTNESLTVGRETVGLVTLNERLVPNTPPIEDAWVFPRVIIRAGIRAEELKPEVVQGLPEGDSITIYKTEAEAKAALEGTRAGEETTTHQPTASTPKEVLKTTNTYSLVGAGKNELKHKFTTRVERGLFPLEVRGVLELISSGGAVWISPFTTTVKENPGSGIVGAWGAITSYIDLVNPFQMTPGEQFTVRVRIGVSIAGTLLPGEARIWLAENPKVPFPLNPELITNEGGTLSLFYSPQPFDRNAVIDRGVHTR